MRAHRFDPLSFIAGLVFTVLGVAAAAGGLDDLDTIRIGWPIVFIVLGVLLVGSTIRNGQPAPSPAAPTSPDELGSEPQHDAPAHDDVRDEVVDEVVDEGAHLEP